MGRISAWPDERGPPRGKSAIDCSSVTTVRLGLAKYVFQVHCADASGRVVVTKAIEPRKILEFFASLPPCVHGLEVCESTHHWAREFTKLGHRGANNACREALCASAKEQGGGCVRTCGATIGPCMWFVGLRSFENQAALMRPKTREMLILKERSCWTT